MGPGLRRDGIVGRVSEPRPEAKRGTHIVVE